MKSLYYNLGKEFQSSSHFCPPFCLSLLNFVRAVNHFYIYFFYFFMKDKPFKYTSVCWSMQRKVVLLINLSQFECLFYKQDELQLERFLAVIVSVKKESLERKGRKLNLAPKSGIFLTGR